MRETLEILKTTNVDYERNLGRSHSSKLIKNYNQLLEYLEFSHERYPRQNLLYGRCFGDSRTESRKSSFKQYLLKSS